MVGFHDLSNELVLMIWDFVELEDLNSFSTISKKVLLLTHELLCEHRRLDQRLSAINNVRPESTEPGVFGRVLKEILLNPRAARYPSLLWGESWEFEWEDKGRYSRGTVPESDLALFKQAVRDNVDFKGEELEKEWLAAIDNGDEEPLIALLLLLLPNLRDVRLGSDLIGSYCICDILSHIACDKSSRSLRKLRSVGLACLATGDDSIGIEHIVSIAALPSVTSITGYGIGVDPENLPQPEDFFYRKTNVTDLRFMQCLIGPKTMSDFLSTTCNLQRFYYSPAGFLTNFDPFCICNALLANARDTLKSLTILPGEHARPFMGSLKKFTCLESLETDYQLLLGDPSTSSLTLSSTLPSSIVNITLHIKYSVDGSCYQASLCDIVDSPTHFRWLREVSIRGMDNRPATEFALQGLVSMLEARCIRLSF